MQSRAVITGLLLALFAAVPAAWAQSTAELLQEAEYARDIEGDLSKAIELYDQVIEADGGRRDHVAQAMYNKGMCYMSLNRAKDAQGTFEALVQEYSEQTQLIERAQQILNDLAMIDPAALMPANTVHYVEIGSPGHQVEMILNMIQGTPLEDSLNSMHPGGGPLAAILNPSMVAELKKMKGVAVGLQDLKEETPDFVAVLYPGRSDALWAMIKAGIGMAAVPVEPLGDFNMAVIEDEIGVAYNDQVLILTHRAEAVKEVVARYKGELTGESLADSGHFNAAGKKARQSNTLTIWTDVDNFYSIMTEQVPPEHLPPELAMVNELLDFANINFTLSQLRLEGQRITWDEEVYLKPGHKCLVHNLMLTPALTEAGYTGVPADSIALMSFSLSDPERKIQQLEEMGVTTGLDMLRDLAVNVQQVNAFIVPPPDGGIQAYTDLLATLGLSVTSHDPARTAAVFGQYLPPFIQQKQVGNANLVALNPRLLEAGADSAAAQGPLQSSLARRPAGTSKALTVNLGGLFDLLGPVWTTLVPQEEQEGFEESLRALAEAFRSTNLDLYTVETADTLKMHMSLNDLPPMNQCFEPLAEVIKIMERSANARAQTASSYKGLRPAPAAIVLDGQVDDAWSAAEAHTMDRLFGEFSGPGDADAQARVLYDDDYLYMLVEVTDDAITSTSPNWWDNDSVIIYLDADYSRGDYYFEGDYMFYASWQPDGSFREGENMTGGEGIAEWTMTVTENGYIAEARIPWAKVGIAPSPGRMIGFDVQVSETDGSGLQEAVLGWFDHKNAARHAPKAFGTLCLQGLVGQWSGDDLLRMNAEQQGADAETFDLLLPYFNTSFGDGFTVVMDARPSQARNWARFVELGNGMAADNIIFGREATTDNAAFEVWQNATQGSVLRAQGVLAANEWHTYAATVDAAGAAKIYRDGELVASGAVHPPGYTERTLNRVGHGSWRDGPESYIGEYGDLHIYNRVLSPEELRELPAR